MTRARDFADVISGQFDLPVGSLDNAVVGNGDITTAKLADAAVTTAKLTDANVTTAKLADANVTTAKLADSAVTDAKISGMASSKLTGAMPALDGSALTGLESFTTAELTDLSSTAIITGLPTDWKIMHLQWYNFRTNNSTGIRYRVGGVSQTTTECATMHHYSVGSNSFASFGSALYTDGAIFIGNWGSGIGHTGNARIIRMDNGSNKVYIMDGQSQPVDYSTYGGVQNMVSLFSTTGHFDGIEFYSAGTILAGLARVFYL